MKYDGVIVLYDRILFLKILGRDGDKVVKSLEGKGREGPAPRTGPSLSDILCIF